MTTLKDLYIDELRDLQSANDQMAELVAEMADRTSDHGLADRLSGAKAGIDNYTRILTSLLDTLGVEPAEKPCKGMECLVSEARKHAIDSYLEGGACDVAIIAQFQRLCCYGIAGFGTAKALAGALGESDAVGRFDAALDNTYDCDGFMTELAERSCNIAAVA